MIRLTNSCTSHGEADFGIRYGVESAYQKKAIEDYGELSVAAQIPAAVADVECKYATNYAQELEAIAAANRTIVEHAEAVLNE